MLTVIHNSRLMKLVCMLGGIHNGFYCNGCGDAKGTTSGSAGRSVTELPLSLRLPLRVHKNLASYFIEHRPYFLVGLITKVKKLGSSSGFLVVL